MPAEMKKVTIDGVSCEAEAPVVATLHQLTEKIKIDSAAHQDAMDELQANLDTVEAERDQLKADKAELEKKLADAPADFQARVDARLALVQAAKDTGVEIKADMSDKDIKVAVIAKADANFKADGRSDAYIDGRFDAALDSLKPDASASRQATSNIKTDSVEKPAGQKQVFANRIDQAEAEMRERNANAYKKPTTQAK